MSTKCHLTLDKKTYCMLLAMASINDFFEGRE